jgi:hypothetical protein
MKSIYLPVVRSEGIYEVIRADDNGCIVIVQTNIRTVEKAKEACRTWQERANQSMSSKISDSNL